jgi:hypothetical protein
MAITRIGSYGQLKGTAYKLPCRLATTATVTLSTPPSSVDGITIQDGDRILVWKQSNAAENGIYVSEASDWTRAVDFSIDDDVLNGIQVYVNEGDTYFKTAFALENTGVITLGTTLLVFNPISSGGSGSQGPQGSLGFQGFQGPQSSAPTPSLQETVTVNKTADEIELLYAFFTGKTFTPATAPAGFLLYLIGSLKSKFSKDSLITQSLVGEYCNPSKKEISLKDISPVGMKV